VRTVQSLDAQKVNFDLYDREGLAKPALPSCRRQVRQVMVPIVDTLTAVAMRVVVVVGGSMVLGNSLDSADGGVPVYIPALLRSDPLAHHAYSVMQRAMALRPTHLRVLDVRSTSGTTRATVLSPTWTVGGVPHVTFGTPPASRC